MQQQSILGRAFLASALVAVVGIALIGCGSSEVSTLDQGTAAVPTRPIDAVLTDHTATLMAIPGVVGVYQGELDNGTPCIGVLVIEAKPEIVAKIPQRLEGYPVRVEPSGEIRPMDE